METQRNNPKKIGIKRLFWDIEVSPNVVFSWRVGFNLNIGPHNIIEERKVICIAYKWEHEKKITVLRWDPRTKDDRRMLCEFTAVAEEADELVAHYGDNFDMPWFRGRCAILGLPPLPKFKTVDTKAWASKYFYFNSNKLDYLGDIFGYGRKIKTDFELWIDVVRGSQLALDKMCRYCGRDVLRLSQVYSRLAPFVAAKTHVGVLAGGERWQCPHCGGTHVKHSKRRVTSTGTVQHQMKCLDDGFYYQISQKAFSAYLKYKNGKDKAARV